MSQRIIGDKEYWKGLTAQEYADYFPAHDAFATETPGAIHDRSREHLGTTDICIVAARRALLAAVEDVRSGREPVHVVRDPAANDMSHIVVVSEVVPPGADHHDVWKKNAQKPKAAAE